MKIRKIERKNLQQTTDPMEKNPKDRIRTAQENITTRKYKTNLK